MRKDDRFTSERLEFWGIGEADRQDLVRWRSDPEVIRYFRSTVPATPQSHDAWFHQSYLKNPRRYDFLFAVKETGQRAGTVGVNQLDRAAGSCEISYMVAEPACQRKGYATEAIAALMDYLKGQGIRICRAEIHKHNAPSIRTVEKLGFARTDTQGDFLIYTKYLFV